MMGRFCRYIDKVFRFGKLVGTIHDSRSRPQIPTEAIWMSAFVRRTANLPCDLEA